MSRLDWRLIGIKRTVGKWVRTGVADAAVDERSVEIRPHSGFFRIISISISVSYIALLEPITGRDTLELAPEAARTPSADSQLAAKYRALVEAHFRTQMSIVEYACALCVSTERLRLACVRSTASSPLALLNARRLLEAKRNLLYTNMSIALIAETCGFTDPAYFSRFFAKNTGKSAREYRLRK